MNLLSEVRMKQKLALNIAAGKMLPLDLDYFHLINLDTMYYNHQEPSIIEQSIHAKPTTGRTFYCKADAFEFMERTQLYFDQICVYRFLEHVSFTQLEYFIYLLSTVTQPGAIVDIIVPNYIQLAEMILNDNPNMSDFAAKNILLTTELLNEPSCPHASIWTPKRAKHFFELEKRFRIVSIDPAFKYDGRDIYMRFKAERV